MVELGREFEDQESDGFDLELDRVSEQELRASLRPRPAPEGFVDRVLARVEELPWREPTRSLLNQFQTRLCAVLLRRYCCWLSA